MFLLSNLVEQYESLSFISLVIGIVTLFVAIILFFYFHVIRIIQDLTGRSERHAIQHMVDNSNRRYRSNSRKLQKVEHNFTEHITETSLLSEEAKEKAITERLFMEEDSETVLLDEGETVVLSDYVEETTVLNERIFEVIKEIRILATKERVIVESKY